MAVRKIIIFWTLVLSSMAQDTSSFETPAPWKTQEDANLNQRSRTQNANIGDLHDDSNPLAGNIVRISGDQDDINAADERNVEFRDNMKTSRLQAQQLQPKHIEDFRITNQHVPPESNIDPEHLFSLSETEQDVLDDYHHRLSLEDPLYDEIRSANGQGRSRSSSSDAALTQYAFLPEETPADNVELVSLIQLPVVEDHNPKSVNYALKNLRFTQKDKSILGYGQHWPIHTINHGVREDHHQELDSADSNVNGELDRADSSDNGELDRADTSVNGELDWADTRVNGENNRLGSDFEDIKALEDKGKRRFDTISDSSFGGFGKRQNKRKFDSISGISSFGGFGKRQDKRKFDSISGISSFGGFGKRQDKRKFDSISGISSFGGFGKRQDKRKFDSISGISSFGGFGKRQDKRKFDSISGIRSFGGFGKRQEKRQFDSISGISSFGRFGKRQDKRKFDSISGISSFGRFGKRQDKKKFDSISGVSSFGGFGKRQDKRKFDSISGVSSFGGFGKRQDKRKFDSISGVSSFGGLGKRYAQIKFAPEAKVLSFAKLGKMSTSNNMKQDPFEGDVEVEEKRKFDLISGHSSFGQFGKRQKSDIENSLSTSGVSSFDAIDKSLDDDKSLHEDNRRFDSFSGISSSGSFEKRHERENGNVDAKAEVGSLESFIDNKELYSNPDVLSFKTFGINTAKTNHQMANLDDKIATMYDKKRDKVDNIYKELRTRQHNDSQRTDKFNTLHVLIQDLRNIEQADERHNLRSNSKDYEDVDAWRINNYNNLNIADNDPSPDSDTLSKVYNNNRLVFIKRKLDRIESNKMFGTLGKRTMIRNNFNSEYNLHSQKTEDVSKRRFDRISTKGNVFRSFGKRSPRSIGTLPKFHEFDKRPFDRISDISNFGRFGKRAYNVLEYLSPGGLGSNNYNATDAATSNWTGKPQYNGKPNSDPPFGFKNSGKVNGGSTAKRRFDSIDHSSSFGMFAKKGSSSVNFVVPGLDPDVVGLPDSHIFPPKQSQEPLTLDYLPLTVLGDVMGLFSTLRVDKDRFRSIGQPSILRMSEDHSSTRWR